MNELITVGSIAALCMLASLPFILTIGNIEFETKFFKPKLTSNAENKH